jgi:hypothetical protein
MNRNAFCIVMLLCAALTAGAQTLNVKQPFQAIPNSSVLASYKNQFGSWEQGDSFPYAVIRVALEGNANEVMAAKQLLHLDMGELGTEISVYKGVQNELLFLVPIAAQKINMTCGADCAQQQIIVSSAPLQKNTVYMGRVQYVPATIQKTTANTEQQILRQFFRFHLTPADAIVSVNVEGVEEVWTTKNGMAYKMLPHGSYSYSVSAEGYQTQYGSMQVSDESREMHVELMPLF